MIPAWLPEDPNQWVDSFRFFTPVQVRFSDTDMLGHINNVSYFSYFEHGRIAYFEELNLTDRMFDLHSEHSGIIVAASLECQYLRQVHFGQKVNLGVRISRIGNSSMDFEYALLADDQLAAAGRGTVVYINPKTGKSQPLPEEIKQAIREFENSATNVH
ncbi:MULTISPECIES: thioesterase family protein [Thermoactinomyces]|jgi:acyl-CoA thioester hydrolase|uniref:Acyl-CoA thioesterase n=1 Tax=Thermoactinomyces daqus TaxID=1329516 RepID=A0A7W1XBQ9_9BACL|nr:MULTISPECIES: thioesterase family protein [Thermoactinomyces]MBA4543654.1 acyl-CoA thioesterase [Thermoactinomyces daqus]MBH8597105.1 acyl-CoA thioesterase [Thermoactinomyces sp. CICC 10523]MBH8602665.1 acyl-CoA thioesterase [Thermoactinomyces sp. CICC 10522]MBH8606224.1 acyl-CoA thioesterase [Thermoactinomyces sp. CICC 10521]